MNSRNLQMRDTFNKNWPRVAITVVLALIAIFLATLLWRHYMDAPWTRDGRVRADIVNVAPDVAGLVTEVAVHDNQFVHKGDLLFKIDDAHYKNTLAEAQALVAQRKALLDVRMQEAQRRLAADDKVVSRENREDASVLAAGAKSDYEAALAQLEQAKLNLERTTVKSPVDGWVSNLLVREGDYAQVGSAKLALVDQHSFWVYGYFEEHKLKYIHEGDVAEVHLLGNDAVIKGHVDSFARGITDRDNPTDVRLLANVNPSFNWVRLAQRIPVRITLDDVPDSVTLVAGLTCSVTIKPSKK